MDKNFDFNSKKYMILLILICLVFVIMIVKAFEYLPENEPVDTNDIEIEHINTPSKVSPYVKNKAENTEEQKPAPAQKSGVLYKSRDSLASETIIEEIDAPPGAVEESAPAEMINENQRSQLSPEELALKSIINARKYFNSGNLTSSLEEYKKAIDLTNDTEIQAEAYEGISLLYAKNKKYGTALSFATKAYKSSPSISREVLIAKIYYSAGKIDTAVAKLNQMLRQGF